MKSILMAMLVATCVVTIHCAKASQRSDTNGAEELVSEVFAVKYANASAIADVLKSECSRDGGELVRTRHLIVDKRSNSLLISTSRSDMKTIRDIVSKLDVVLPQVLIEGAVLEVQLPKAGRAGRRHPACQRPAPADRLLGSSMAWFTNLVGRVTTDGFASQQRGFWCMAALGNGFDLTIAALSNDRGVNVIQKPRIQTSSGASATVSLSKIHFPRNYSCSSYPGSPIPRSWIEELGEIVMTPSLKLDGLIAMEIQATVYNVIGNAHISAGHDVANTNLIRSRVSAVVRDGDILIIGVAFRSPKQRTCGLPVLRHITVIGAFFRDFSARRPRNEIIVLLRPTILPSLTSERALQ